jgi:hypothetical protein
VGGAGVVVVLVWRLWLLVWVVLLMGWGVVALLAIWTGRVELAPSWTEPKSRAMGETVMGDGVAVPRRLTNSRAVLASEVISRALMRVAALVAEGCGVKVTMRMQLAEGMMVVQLLWTVKSGVVWRAAMGMGTVPVLLRVMGWGWAAWP